MERLHERYVELVRAGPNGLFSKGDLDRLQLHAADGAAGAETLRGLVAASIVDVGSGGGVPGVPLAIELPDASVTMVESQRWKCEFLRTCARALDLESRLKVEALRAEEAPASLGRECFDAGTARALAPPLVVAEYLSPLVRIGGHLVLWSTAAHAQDPSVDANEILGLDAPTIQPCATELRADGVLIVWPKLSPCAERIPRRTGVAARRPLR